MDAIPYYVPERICWKVMDESVVIVDVATGNYYSLNETASLVWQAIAEGSGIEDIIRDILGKYEVDARLLRENISHCVDEWLKQGLICEKGASEDEGKEGLK